MKKTQNYLLQYIKDMFNQEGMIKRTILALIATIVLGFGVSMFSISGFGVDPYTSMAMNVSATIGMGFGTFEMLANILLLIVILAVSHRGLVGVGTIFNMVGVGYTCQFFNELLGPSFAPYSHNLALRIALMLIGLVFLCFACGLFISCNVGVGAYDAVSIVFNQKTGFPYKWSRVLSDIIVILIGIAISGGLIGMFSGDFTQVKNIGIGTIITAFMMGPLVNFFKTKVCDKIVNTDYLVSTKGLLYFMFKGAFSKNND